MDEQPGGIGEVVGWIIAGVLLVTILIFLGITFKDKIMGFFRNLPLFKILTIILQ